VKIRVEVSDEDLGKALLQKVLDMLNELPGAYHAFPYPFDLRTSGNLVCLVKNNNSAYWLVESEKITALVDAANILINGEIRTWG
jgi:hypothetical protein